MSTQAAACPGCENEQTHVFDVEGMCCAAEVAMVEDRLGRLAGVCSVRASAVTGKATVVHTIGRRDVEQALAGLGFRARSERAAATPSPRPAGTIAALALTGAGALAALGASPASVPLYLAAILIGGAPIARTGWRRMRQGSLDMNALMAVAVTGAMVIGEWGEGASTVVLFSLAQLLEARSLERARRAISGLMSLAPETALVRRGGSEERIAAAAVAPGDHIFVKPGERIALDGVIVAGISDVDQSPITGESRPVPRAGGDGVFAGSINGTVKGIRGNLGALQPVVRSINDGVADINGRADRAIRDVRNIKTDLANVLAQVGGGGTGGHTNAGGKTISGHANSIDCSLAILNSQGCEK